MDSPIKLPRMGSHPRPLLSSALSSDERYTRLPCVVGIITVLMIVLGIIEEWTNFQIHLKISPACFLSCLRCDLDNVFYHVGLKMWGTGAPLTPEDRESGRVPKDGCHHPWSPAEACKGPRFIDRHTWVKFSGRRQLWVTLPLCHLREAVSAILKQITVGHVSERGRRKSSRAKGHTRD